MPSVIAHGPCILSKKFNNGIRAANLGWIPGKKQIN